jgi:AraC family transcriptional regulator of arabinose operon
MKKSEKTFWNQYIANMQIDLSIAAYTKVSDKWGENDYIPTFNKMYYITEGEGFLKVKDQLYYPKPGEIYLMPAGVVQSYGTLTNHTFGKYWCHFTAKIGEHHLFQALNTSPFITIEEQHAERWKTKFEQLIDYTHSDKLTAKIHINAILLELIADYIEQCDQVKFNLKIAPAFEKMNAVLQHIDAHLTDNLTVDGLAEIAHFHPNYFIQLFKNFTGCSPIQYINRIRLEKAKHLLAMTEFNVSTIAEAVGLELSYFSRMFREHNGFSPTTYRDMVPKPTVMK